MNNIKSYSTSQLVWLVILRLAIGWHFLYEGLYKILKSSWTSKHYLEDADGWCSTIFADIASNPTLLAFADFANIWGLTLIGAGLIAGLFSRYAAIAGVVVLAIFYISHIPFIGAIYMMPAEGNYLWFDKNIVEICALMIIIVFPTSHIIGLDRLLYSIRKKQEKNGVR